MREKESVTGRVAITLSSRGVDTVSFLSGDRTEALAFYLLVEPEIRLLEERILQLFDGQEGKKNDG